jgi:predicted DNA-binding protein YlxM (UPF0122 family)
MIITIQDYCKQRGISRQFVYSYIKSGKFKHYEMPTFVEINGEKINIGVQKILEIPDEFAPKKTNLTPITEGSIGNLEDLLNRLTDNKELKTLYQQLLTDKNKETARLHLNEAIEAHPERDRLRIAEDEASIRLLQHMKQTNSFLENFVKEAQAAVEQPA